MENNSDTNAAERAFNTVTKFLEEDGWHPAPIEDKTAHRMRFTGKHGEYGMIAHVRGDLDQLICYAIVPNKVAEEMRPQVAEYITRANYGLRIGNLEMDYSDGEVRYKSSIDFEGIELQPIMVKNTIYPAAMTLDRYMPGLLGMLYGGKTAEQAINDVENPPNDPPNDPPDEG